MVAQKKARKGQKRGDISYLWKRVWHSSYSLLSVQGARAGRRAMMAGGPRKTEDTEPYTPFRAEPAKPSNAGGGARFLENSSDNRDKVEGSTNGGGMNGAVTGMGSTDSWSVGGGGGAGEGHFDNDRNNNMSNFEVGANKLTLGTDLFGDSNNSGGASYQQSKIGDGGVHTNLGGGYQPSDGGGYQPEVRVGGLGGVGGGRRRKNFLLGGPVATTFSPTPAEREYQPNGIQAGDQQGGFLGGNNNDDKPLAQTNDFFGRGANGGDQGVSQPNVGRRAAGSLLGQNNQRIGGIGGLQQKGGIGVIMAGGIQQQRATGAGVQQQEGMGYDVQRGMQQFGGMGVGMQQQGGMRGGIRGSMQPLGGTQEGLGGLGSGMQQQQQGEGSYRNDDHQGVMQAQGPFLGHQNQYQQGSLFQSNQQQLQHSLYRGNDQQQVQQSSLYGNKSINQQMGAMQQQHSNFDNQPQQGLAVGLISNQQASLQDQIPQQDSLSDKTQRGGDRSGLEATASATEGTGGVAKKMQFKFGKSVLYLRVSVRRVSLLFGMCAFRYVFVCIFSFVNPDVDSLARMTYR